MVTLSRKFASRHNKRGMVGVLSKCRLKENGMFVHQLFTAFTVDHTEYSCLPTANKRIETRKTSRACHMLISGLCNRPRDRCVKIKTRRTSSDRTENIFLRREVLRPTEQNYFGHLFAAQPESHDVLQIDSPSRFTHRQIYPAVLVLADYSSTDQEERPTRFTRHQHSVRFVDSAFFPLAFERNLQTQREMWPVLCTWSIFICQRLRHNCPIDVFFYIFATEATTELFRFRVAFPELSF